MSACNPLDPFLSFLPENFLLLLGLWSCGQREALSKRLWSTRRVVHQVRQIHSQAVAKLTVCLSFDPCCIT